MGEAYKFYQFRLTRQICIVLAKHLRGGEKDYMRLVKAAVVTFAIMAAALVATAQQEYPKAEAAIMYQYLRTSTTGFPEQFNMNGGVGSVTFNFAKHVGIEAEFGGSYTGNVRGFDVTVNEFHYLFGPKFTSHGEKVSVYGHALFGGARLGGTITECVGEECINTGGSNNSMAMVVGGGVDFNVNKRFSVRPAQLDYFMTRFDVGGASNTQNNLRYAAGVVFKF
jgi:outer membrane immunogenic protein